MAERNQGRLAGRVALVTGASRGIGAAVAQRLAAEGAAVALCARTVAPDPRLPGTLDETAAAIERLGGTALRVPADLTDPAARRRAVEATRSALGPIDILVNNAAAAFYLPFEEITEKRFRIAFEMNARAPFELAQLVVPSMRERRQGWIVNISSAVARHPQGPPFDDYAVRGGALLYGMSKAALERFTTGLAAELHADGIAVNALSPVAAVETPGATAHGITPERLPEMFEPMEVMVEAVLALCCADPAVLTGRIAYSRPLLEELGIQPRSLDGRARAGA